MRGGSTSSRLSSRLGRTEKARPMILHRGSRLIHRPRSCCSCRQNDPFPVLSDRMCMRFSSATNIHIRYSCSCARTTNPTRWETREEGKRSSGLLPGLHRSFQPSSRLARILALRPDTLSLARHAIIFNTTTCSERGRRHPHTKGQFCPK